jgi:hypothetical protein
MSPMKTKLTATFDEDILTDLGTAQSKSYPETAAIVCSSIGEGNVGRCDCDKKLGKGGGDVGNKSETFHRNPAGGKPVR